MEVRRLSEAESARLLTAPFNYDGVGSTASRPPAGYHSFQRSRVLAPQTDFASAAQALLTWQVQLRAGVRVTASSDLIEPDVVVILRLGPRPFSVSAPCRVVYVVDEVDRKGFAYGTLPGHPEAGQESFVIERLPSGLVQFTVAAFSRHASTLAKVGGPVTTLVQRRVTDRYLHSLDRAR